MRTANVKYCISSSNFKTIKTSNFLFLFISNLSHSQSLSKQFKSLSCPERWWVTTHLFVAKKAFQISNEARLASKEMEKDTLLDHDADGGQVDAFRHSYWMARLSQEMCWRKALKLGKAHEKGNYQSFKKHKYEDHTIPDSAAGVMDLFNNKVGIEIGCIYKQLSSQELVFLLRDKILAGEMKVIQKNQQGQSLNCQGNVIGINAYSGVWNIPRCIVTSNTKRQ